MATDSPQSDFDLNQLIAGNSASAAEERFPWDIRIRKRGDFDLWLEGEVLACACPDCGSPMSVRLWLKLADCWRCGSGIELSEQLVEKAERLLEEARQEKQAPATPPQSSLATTQSRSAVAPAPPPPPPTPPTAKAPSRSPTPQPPPTSRRVAAATQAAGVKRKKKEQEIAPLTLYMRQAFRDLPAWIASLVLHLAALLLLAVWLLPAEPAEDPFITVSTKLDNPNEEGEVLIPKNLDTSDFNEAERAEFLAMKQRVQDAKKIQIDRDANLPAAPPIHTVVSNIKSSNPGTRMVAARDPRVRAEIVKKEGGTTSTEASVSRGLDWLARNQLANGSWSLRAHGGKMETDAGATSLALLPFLGAGQTHLVGIYQDTVDKGLGYLLSIQKPNGDLRGNSQQNAGMYAHGQAAIVLAEAYKITGDEKLKEPAQKALDFIVEAQHPQGGWRYQPGEAGDLSVSGWQIMALYSGKSAGLEVPDSTVKLAGYFLDSVQHGDHGGLYGYLPKKAPKPTMTAEGLLCRMYLGWTLKNPGLVEGVDHLNQHPPDKGESSIYYIYYATQAMHHVGGKDWDNWNLKMRDNLVSSQATTGKEAGSWTPRDQHDASGGRLYATALCTATLEVYYRHAPLFRQIDLD